MTKPFNDTKNRQLFQCPKCKELITLLIRYEVYNADESVVYAHSNSPTVMRESWVDEVGFYSEEYKCPQCHRLLARTEEQALKLINNLVDKKDRLEQPTTLTTSILKGLPL
jgi:phage FluMu protein Com